jgi:hypothetical protein
MRHLTIWYRHDLVSTVAARRHPHRARADRVGSGPDGAKVYGSIDDAGSNGGAGMNRFGEVVLAGR